MRILTAILVAAAVLSTSVVSVRLHLHVARLRYRVAGLEADRTRSERDLRVAQSELDLAKAPKALLERWARTHEGPARAPQVARPEERPAPADERLSGDVVPRARALAPAPDPLPEPPADAPSVPDDGAEPADPVAPPLEPVPEGEEAR